VVAQKLARLQSIVAERVAWAEQLAHIKRLHAWLLEVEHLLDASPAPEGEVVSNETVGSRLDAWRAQMATQLTDGSFSELERECLTEFLQVLSNLRPYLVQCYDRKDFPRTNNDMERSIRGLKTQYRRVSGRKNWNAYLLRHGRAARLRRLVGARRGPSKVTGTARRPAGPDPLARTATGDHPRSQRATHALPLSSAGLLLLSRYLCPDGFKRERARWSRNQYTGNYLTT